MLTFADIKLIFEKCKHIKGGKNAEYIPELAKVNPNIFAISVFTVHGIKYDIGDFTKEIAIESVSKVFTLACALKKFGPKVLKEKIGDEASALPFNSIEAVDTSVSHTMNSFDNGGAMATASLLYQPNVKAFKKELETNMDAFAGRKLSVNYKIYQSELSNLDHNLALAFLLKSYKKFYGDIMKTVDAYTYMCSKNVTSADLAVMAATLANGGVNPLTLEQVIPTKLVPYILDQMFANGMYTESPAWFNHVGFPAKSGVGGAIIIVIPGRMGIAIVSPPLNKAGNSHKGTKTAILLAQKLNEGYAASATSLQ